MLQERFLLIFVDAKRAVVSMTVRSPIRINGDIPIFGGGGGAASPRRPPPNRLGPRELCGRDNLCPCVNEGGKRRAEFAAINFTSGKSRTVRVFVHTKNRSRALKYRAASVGRDNCSSRFCRPAYSWLRSTGIYTGCPQKKTSSFEILC